MSPGEKIQKILDIENINLKQFSSLAGISYSAARDYRKNRYALSVLQIDKICSVPRFAQYRNMLLSLDEPIGEGSTTTTSTSYAASRVTRLAAELEKIGLGEHARDMLQILLDASRDAKKD